MKTFARATVTTLLVLGLLHAVRARAQQGDFLSDDEEDALRDAQDPAQRIEVYLNLEQTRLARLEDQKGQPAELHKLLSQFVSLNEEMKDWIQDQYSRHGDMRKGLRALLDRGPQQLDQFKQMQQWPDAAGAEYASDLRDAMDSVTDGLNGATKAFSDQQKMFGVLKREQKANEQATKERVKEEKKRNKKEKKLRKRLERQSKSNSDEN
jgi:hypothetical protein